MENFKKGANVGRPFFRIPLKRQREGPGFSDLPVYLAISPNPNPNHPTSYIMAGFRLFQPYHGPSTQRELSQGTRREAPSCIKLHNIDSWKAFTPHPLSSLNYSSPTLLFPILIYLSLLYYLATHFEITLCTRWLQIESRKR